VSFYCKRLKTTELTLTNGYSDGTGYDIYDLWDLGEFDQKGGTATHWGTKAELLDAIKVAKEAGIITYIDAVLNHKAGADEAELFKAIMVDRNNREKDVATGNDVEGWTKWV
jgi:alpha-amylase